MFTVLSSSVCFGLADQVLTELQDHCKAPRRGLLGLTESQSARGNRSLGRGDSQQEATTGASETKDLILRCLHEKTPNSCFSFCCGAILNYYCSDCDLSGCRGSTTTSSAIMSIHQKMSTNSTVDHCQVPNPVMYKILSWLMIGEFMLGLPINLSVLYIFIFRYEKT